MRNNIKKNISIFVILIMLIQVFIPIVSQATDVSGVSGVSEGDITLNVELKRDETNPNKINITATDSKYNITDLKYVHKYIETSNANYFEEDNDDIYIFDITPSQSIQKSFELNGYGSYTVYAKNEVGRAFLARVTANDPNNMPKITLTRDEENLMNVTINVTSKNNIIEKIKIAKMEDINDDIDFSIEGTDIEFIKSGDVTVKYTRSN